MKSPLLALSAMMLLCSTNLWAQAFPYDSSSSSSSSSSSGGTNGGQYGSSVADQQKLSASTLNSLRAVLSNPFTKVQVISNSVTLENGLRLNLDDFMGTQTRADQSRATRTLVTRRSKISTVPGIYSYYFHLFEKSSENKDLIIADVYLRIDVRTDNSDNGEISFLTEKPAAVIESVFKPVETKIAGTLLANIQIRAKQ